MKIDSTNSSSEDFYFNENGLVVMTEKYHIKRGYCCQSGCKHCPYGFKKENNGKIKSVK